MKRRTSIVFGEIDLQFFSLFQIGSEQFTKKTLQDIGFRFAKYFDTQETLKKQEAGLATV